MNTYLALLLIAAGVIIAEGITFIWGLIGSVRALLDPDFCKLRKPITQTRKEDYSMNPLRYGLVATLAVLLILFAGCGTLGNGRLDVPVEVEVVYVDSMGAEYHAEIGPNGSIFYVAVDGDVFVPVEYGENGLVITGPDGSRVRVKKIAEVPAPDPPPSPETQAALRHVHEAVG